MVTGPWLKVSSFRLEEPGIEPITHRPNKIISVFRLSLKILGREGTHIFFFSGKNIILCILKGISPFKMPKKGSGYPKHRYFFYLATKFLHVPQRVFWTKYNFMHFETHIRISPFKVHKIVFFFPET